MSDARALRLGLLLELDQHGDLAAQLDQWADLARLAERHGFASLWVPEGFPAGSPTANPPSALVIVAALAHRTALDLGTGVVLLPAAQPLRLAYETALVDRISGGRLHLGVGMGDPDLVRRFGVDRATLGTFADETLAALRALWSGAAGFDGSVVRIEGGIFPLPARPGGPPIWVGGYVRRTIERAVRFGDAFYFGSASTLPIVRTMTEQYRAALAAAGKDVSHARVAVNRFALVADTDDAARTAARLHIGPLLQRYAASGSVRDGSGARTLSPDAAFASLEATMALVGSAERVGERLRQYSEAGVTDVHLRVRTGTTPLDIAARTIELIGGAARG
jgi:alkanesulfonate monooxygenase SsuD/methylene tetrahydromethanopterin reductase-like flavin-dependent oxidoreductase (luciferase family)